MNSEKQYIQAFNNGYLLAEHEPKLLNSISKGLTPKNCYLEGLLQGKKQFESENVKDHLYELKRLRSQSNDKSNFIDRDL